MGAALKTDDVTKAFNNSACRNDRNAQLAIQALRQADPEGHFMDRSGNEPLSAHARREQEDAIRKLENSHDPNRRAGAAALRSAMKGECGLANRVVKDEPPRAPTQYKTKYGNNRPPGL